MPYVRVKSLKSLKNTEGLVLKSSSFTFNNVVDGAVYSNSKYLLGNTYPSYFRKTFGPRGVVDDHSWLYDSAIEETSYDIRD